MKASRQNNRKQSKGVSSSPKGQELCHTSKVHRQHSSKTLKSSHASRVLQSKKSSPIGCPLSPGELIRDGAKIREWNNVRTDLSPINPPPLPPKK